MQFRFRVHLRYSSLDCSAGTTPCAALYAALCAALTDTRHQTLSLIADIPSDFLRKQSHPDFSPIGWHLGHIAYTESMWIAEHLNQQPRQFGQYKKLFAADGLPKSERENLPALDELLAYLQRVRSHTITYLNSHPNPTQQTLRLWHWLIQHEGQHTETMAMVLAMHRLQRGLSFNRSMTQPVTSNTLTSDMGTSDMILIESGTFTQGNDAAYAIDNEQPAHCVHIDCYWIDRAPVTCHQYRAFVEAGGYQNRKYWCNEGWQWLNSSNTQQPLYGLGETGFEHYPICGVSWYEASAYARFVNKRLPTEAEWEKAAHADAGGEHRLGNVWEWTDSWFSAYSGFNPFPYEGYSQLYFDGARRVLRGGSWASPQSILRPSFRTWYHPHRREVFAGFRCAL